ncbi:uncharacterized protein LOC144097608 [Amblyomma americanum]
MAAAAAVIQNALVGPLLPGPPGKAPAPKAPVPKSPARPPGKPPAKPVVTTQPAAVTLPPPAPGQPDAKPAAAPPAPQRDVPEEVHLTARPDMTPEKLPDFGDEPVVLTCPQCFRRVKTRVELENGRFAKCMACATCASIVCCCFFWVPLYTDYFKDLYHVCPQCCGILYERKQMG